MGWANCGEDSKGRPIGYAHEAACDEPGCTTAIDRGLSYACGGMHGDDDPEGSCEGYFCGEHLVYTNGPTAVRMCRRCADQIAELDDDHSDCECGADPFGLLDDDPELDPLDHSDLDLAGRVTGPNGCTCGFNGDCNCRFEA